MEPITADITTLEVDAIVNAANESLMPGGGVCGAIHRAAGPKLKEECITLQGCDTGSAKITKGYNLPAKYVIHAVGPVYHDGKSGEPEQLASCYRTCLELAMKHKLKSIAFPAISTGIFGYPLEDATEIAVHTVQQFLKDHSDMLDVTFCCFDDKTMKAYWEQLMMGNRDKRTLVMPAKKA